jgi:hypothetical protein
MSPHADRFGDTPTEYRSRASRPGEAGPQPGQSLGSDGWHDLTAEDATVARDLSGIVLVDHEEHRVGFGT